MGYIEYYGRLLNYRWQCDKSSNVPYYIQFADYIASKIVAGDIPRRFKLPAITELSAYSGLSRNTVSQSLDILAGRSLIEKTGSKLFRVAYPEDKRKMFNWFYFIKRGGYIIKDVVYEALIDRQYYNMLLASDVASRSYGYRELIKNYIDILPSTEGSFADTYYDNMLTHICAYLCGKNINADTSNTIATNSAQMLMSVLSDILYSKDVTYIIPECSRPSICIHAEISGLNIRYVKCCEDGPLIADLYKHITNCDNPILLIEPGAMWQYGKHMPINRVREISNICYAKDIPIIEFNYTHEHNLNPSTPFKATIDSDNVLFISDFLSSFSPSDHVAFAVGPQELIKEIKHKLHNWFIYSSPICGILGGLLQNGDYDTFISEYKLALQSKSNELCTVLSACLQEYVEVSVCENDVYMYLKLKSNKTLKKFDISKNNLNTSFDGLVYLKNNNSLAINVSVFNMDKVKELVDIIANLFISH